MPNIQTTRRTFLRQATLLTTPVLLSGCSAAKSLINDRIDPVANPGNLEGKQFPVKITTGTRAPVSGTGNYTGSFNDIAPVNRQNLLTFAELRQNLRPAIQYVPSPLLVATSAPLPTRFVLSNLTLAVRLYEAPTQNSAATREVIVPTLSAVNTSLVFNRVAGTTTYQWDVSGEVPFQEVRIGGDDAKRLFSLLTSVDANKSASNFVSASLSVTAQAEGVDNADGGLLFTFGKGEVQVGL